ncbi:MAG: penicillin-binding protein [Bacilli bacterium]|nr:penicillin-binding protein [Bacilli bacterium]
MTKRKKNNIRYSGLVIILSLFLFVIIIGRVLYLGLSKEVDGINLQELASKRTTKTESIQASRGTIYSSNKDVLAQNVTSYKLIAYLAESRTTKKDDPQHVVDKNATAEALAPILGYTKEEVLNYLDKDAYQVEFGIKGKNLNEITKSKIEDLNLPGLDFIESYRRYYPKGDFASYTIGYAKTDEGTTETTGEMGIEKYYDKVLSGENGTITYQKDLQGYRIPDTPVIRKEAVQGKDIYLTIDSNIQFFVEQAILAQDASYDWDWYNFTILDAKTGAILAETTHPSFDPNIKNITNYLDIMLSEPYEPGSTMKTYTYLCAMENGVYDGNETYLSGTYTTSDGTEIGDWNRNGWGVITFDKGYALSSNVGIINIINRHMNGTMLRTCFKKYGFGRKTGITLPNEQTGSLNFKYETEIFNAGFGQGLTTTPIQNAKALTALTNDGMLLKPYLVEKIVDSETGEVIQEYKRTEIERVASTASVQKIISLMDDTVNGERNTGSAYKREDGQLIGKTGTSQIADTVHGGYLDGAHNVITSFAGFYPKDDPKVIIYASVKRPSGGSQKPLSNAVTEVVNNLSKYFGEESSTVTTTEYPLPSFENKDLEQTKIVLSNNNIRYIVIGNGTKVTNQVPNAGSKITSSDTVYLITNEDNIKVPNVIGLSSKTANNILSKLGLNVKLEGVGYVVAQSIPEGSEFTPNQEIVLQLSPRYE